MEEICVGERANNLRAETGGNFIMPEGRRT